MAKATQKKRKPLPKKDTGKEVKKGKTKWILLLLIILLIILLAAGAFFGLGDSLTGFFEETEVENQPEQKIEVVWADKDAKTDPTEDQMAEAQEVPEPMEEPTAVKKRSKGYYIKVEDCMGVTCQQDVIRFLKQEKLPYVKRKYSRTTEYFELVSNSVFTLQTAKEKLDLIKRQPGVLSKPYLVAENKRYRISMGLFPEEETGRRIKSEMAHLFPKVRIDFALKPRDRAYSVTSIFAGPFGKTTANKILGNLRAFPEYESSHIVNKI